MHTEYFMASLKVFPGLTIDRYNSLILAQTFREPLDKNTIELLENSLPQLLKKSLLNHNQSFYFVYNHRGEERKKGFDFWHKPVPSAFETMIFSENGVKYISKARHRGQDPLLFLDMRVGRNSVLLIVRGFPC